MLLDKKERYAIIINVLTIILEIIAFIIRPNRYSAPALAFYTVIANIIAGVSSVFFLITFFSGKFKKFTALCRYTACIFLLVTFLIVVLVLIWFEDPSTLLLDKNNSFHHIIIPVSTVISYLVLEDHIHNKWAVMTPLFISIIYCVILVWCNCEGLVDGPYPFFMTERFGLPAVIGFCAIIAAVMVGVSILFHRISEKISKKNL